MIGVEIYMSDEVIKEKLDNLEDNVMHKLRNNENQLKFIYDDIKDLQARIKYFVMGALALYGMTQGGIVEFIKGLM